MSLQVERTTMWLTFRQLFARKRVVIAIIFAAIPALAALWYRLGTGTTATPDETTHFLMTLYADLVVAALLPLVAVVLGTGAFGGEVDDGTLIYLLMKPAARWRFVAAKFVVTVAATLLVVLPGVLLSWIAVGPSIVSSTIPLAFVGAIAIGTLLYSALFLLFGLSSKRGLIAGLLYVVAVELALSQALDSLKFLSIREYTIKIAGELATGTPQAGSGTVSMTTVWVMGAIIFVGSLLGTIRILNRYESAARV